MVQWLEHEFSREIDTLSSTSSTTYKLPFILSISWNNNANLNLFFFRNFIKEEIRPYVKHALELCNDQGSWSHERDSCRIQTTLVCTCTSDKKVKFRLHKGMKIMKKRSLEMQHRTCNIELIRSVSARQLSYPEFKITNIELLGFINRRKCFIYWEIRLY